MEVFCIRLPHLLKYMYLTVAAVMCASFLLSASVFCGRCQVELQTKKTLIVCNFSQSAISSLLKTNFSSDCQFLELSQNHLQTVDNFAFTKQTHLLYLDLSFNKIKTLKSQTFMGLHQLVCLDLRQNELNFTYEAYPKVVFLPLKQLEILDIRNNFRPTTQTTSPDISFQVLNSLQELRLDLFGTVKLGQGFARLSNMKILASSGSFSSLQTISADYFVSFENLTISSLLLADSQIVQIEMNALRHFRHIKHISLANNHELGLKAAVKSLTDLRNTPLSSIDLRYVNSVYSGIQDQSFTENMGKQLGSFCLRNLDLSDNMIVHMDISGMFHLNSECLEVVLIDNNYLQDQTLMHLFLIVFRFQNLRVASAANSMIPQPTSRHSQIYLDPGLPRSRRSLPIITISFPPKLETFNISHNHLNCYTSGKEIEINGGLNMKIFDMSYSFGRSCFHRRLRGVENLRSLLVSGNEYDETINSIFFSSFPNLTCLTMRDVSLVSRFRADKMLLSPLQQLQHLDIANSGLTSIPRESLSGLLQLKFIDLSLNKLISVPDLTYLSPHLQELDMQYNALINIPLESREIIDLFVTHYSALAISLNGNPLVCNCDTYDFIQWIWTSQVAFDNQGNYSCIVSNGSTVSLLSLRENFRDLQVRCVSFFWVTFGALGVSILFITLLISALVYRYRVPIKYWCHTLCRKPEAKASQRHKYDALVAFCHQDYRWVYRTLYPKLTDSQHGNSYKLCVYDRDFLPGVPIEENIITAINDSFKIILVITPAFVKSTWCQFELQMARMKMIHVGREDVVIPIILHDVPVSSMPKSLLNLWNTSVFLVWSESHGEQRHFWENLMAALGPVSVGEDLEDDHNERNVEEQDIIEQEDETIMVMNSVYEEHLLVPLHTDDEQLLGF